MQQKSLVDEVFNQKKAIKSKPKPKFRYGNQTISKIEGQPGMSFEQSDFTAAGDQEKSQTREHNDQDKVGYEGKIEEMHHESASEDIQSQECISEIESTDVSTHSGWLIREASKQPDFWEKECPDELKTLSNSSGHNALELKRLINDKLQDAIKLDQKRRNEQRELQTLKIFNEGGIEEFSIGTYKYERSVPGKYETKGPEVIKKYIPFFPHLYIRGKREGDNSVGNFNLNKMKCHFYVKNKSTKNVDEDQLHNNMRLPSSIQLQFDLNTKHLLSGTCDYERFQQNNNNLADKNKFRKLQCDINLNQFKSNINHCPKVYCQVEEMKDDRGKVLKDEERLVLIIELNVPVPFFELQTQSSIKQTFQKIVSPLQLQNDLLNYWNLKQVIYIKGKRHENMQNKELENYFRKLVEQELIQSFESSIPSNIDLFYVRGTEDQNATQIFSFGPSNDEAAMQLKKQHQWIRDHGRKFDETIQKLAIPLRMSLMVPISNRSIQIFEPQIIELIEYLIDRGFTVQEQKNLQVQQIKEFWEVERHHEKFEYKAYQVALDHISSKLNIEVPLEANQLIEKVNLLIDFIPDPKKMQLNIVQAKIREQTQHQNRLPQRRMYITPSIKIITPMEVEQSNAILRELKYCIEYMVRINIMNDCFDDEFFNSEKSLPLIESFVKPSINQIKFCGIDLKFLNYSASQIKQKSWWDYVDNHNFGSVLQAEASNEKDKPTSSDKQNSSKSDFLKDTTSQSSDDVHQINLFKKLSDNREEFLDFIGKFKETDAPLKRLARQGQSMSSSTFVQKIKFEDVTLIKDKQTLDKFYTFSDGSGFISPEVMAKVAEIFDFHQVSAIQMRYGGFKGVLVCHPGLKEIPNSPERLPLCLFRESMEKFDGKLTELSVIRCSTYSPAFLNRQVILLLNFLGVKDDVFIKMNENAIKALNVKETCSRLQDKAKKIKNSTNLDNDIALFDDLNAFFGSSRQFSKIFKRAIWHSINWIEESQNGKVRVYRNLDQEPVFSQIMHNMVLSQGMKLRQKARIYLKNGAVLIGVTDIDPKIILAKEGTELPLNPSFDTSNLLQEGEVFCQIKVDSFAKEEMQEKKLFGQQIKKKYKMSDERVLKVCKDISGGDVTLITGKVLITKNPCGHQGDIRPATAIDSSHPAYEKLKHLVNVIVFPSQGKRPLQNMMSGGDLDGDVYMIIWDPRIIKQVYETQEEKGFPPSMEDQDVWKKMYTEEIGKGNYDITDSIAFYFQRDMLGQMSNLHLNLAIQKGVDSLEAERAAFLCSVQVDFAKHGRCIKQEAMLDLRKHVKGRPLFLVEDEENDDIFPTEHVLEQLYKQVEIKKLFKDCLMTEHRFSILHDYEINKFIVQLDRFTQQSGIYEQMYKYFVHPMEQELIEKLLLKFRLVNEGELFCSDYQYRFADLNCQNYIGFLGKSSEDTVAEIKEVLDDIIKTYRNLFKKMVHDKAEMEYEAYIQSQQNKMGDKFKLDNQMNLEEFKNEVTTRKYAARIYLASYYHPYNPHSQSLLLELQSDLELPLKDRKYKNEEDVRAFLRFHQFKLDAILERVQSFQEKNNLDSSNQRIGHQNLEQIREILLNFENYKSTCKKAEANNRERLEMLWSYKQLFSVPWLICWEYLLARKT